MKILVTGAAGFIGSHLCKLFLKRKYEVFGIDNFITGSEKNIEELKQLNNFHFFSDDIQKFDFSELPSTDIAYHLASPASPIQYKKYSIETLLTNSQGTYRVLEYMKKSESKIFVLASTSEVYGDPLIHPQKETYFGNVNPNGVRSCYDEGKRFSESLTMSYFRKYNIDIRIARIFNTYGPNMEKDDGRVVSNFIMQALTNKNITIYGNGTQTRSFCYISDMVEGLFRLGTIDNLAGQVINLGSTYEKSINELANIIKNITKSSSKIIKFNIEEDDPKKRRPDLSKAKTLLKWETKVLLKQGLNKTIDYFKKMFV